MKNNVKEKGITLVSLVVTVVVLLMLTGVILVSNRENNGVFNIANNKKEETEKLSIVETIKTELQEDSPENYDELLEFLKNYGEILNEDNNDETVLVTARGNYRILVKDIWNIDKQELGISVGDYVEYSFDGGKYTIETANSGSNQEQTITVARTTDSLWRVLEVDNQNRLVKIIPSNLNLPTVTFSGVNGFNNAVKILNDICDTVFSNLEYNTTSRNINIEDIEKISSNISALKGTTYGTIKEYNSLIYPSVAKEENDNSQQNKFFSGSETLKNINLMQSYYTGSINYTNEKYVNIIPNGNYWMSTRAINNGNNAEYYLRTIIVSNTVSLSGTKLLDSTGQAGSNTFSILPVVTLNDLIFYSGDGTQESPYKVKE